MKQRCGTAEEFVSLLGSRAPHEPNPFPVELRFHDAAAEDLAESPGMFVAHSPSAGNRPSALWMDIPPEAPPMMTGGFPLP